MPPCSFNRGLCGFAGGNEKFQPGYTKEEYREEMELNTKVSWLRNTSTWLGCTAFRRMPFLPCFCFWWATGIFLLKAEGSGSHFAHVLLNHLVGVKQHLGLRLLYFPMIPFSLVWLLGQVCMFASVIKDFVFWRIHSLLRWEARETRVQSVLVLGVPAFLTACPMGLKLPPQK